MINLFNIKYLFIYFYTIESNCQLIWMARQVNEHFWK